MFLNEVEDGRKRTQGRWVYALLTLEQSFLLFEKPTSAFILSLIIYFGISFAGGYPWRISSHPYFNYLADAFLNGQLHLRLLPPDLLDLSVYEGRYYLYWGPLPALVALPLVALFGVGFSDVLQSIAFGAVNVALFALLLRKAQEFGIIDLSPIMRALLVLFFALGTAFTPLPAAGQVWGVLQLVTLSFVLVTYWAALSFDGKKAFFWTGCGVACIILGRISAVFMVIFPVWFLISKHRDRGWRNLIQYSLLGILPVLAAAGTLGIYNTLRFGSLLENGLAYHLFGPDFKANFELYGVFHPFYIPANFYYTYLHYPINITTGDIYMIGGGLFLLSPLFLASFVSIWQNRFEASTYLLIVSILFANIPILLLMGPGTAQFGPRYTLDFIFPLMILTARGMRKWPLGFIVILIVWSVLHYLFGALLMVL